MDKEIKEEVQEPKTEMTQKDRAALIKMNIKNLEPEVKLLELQVKYHQYNLMLEEIENTLAQKYKDAVPEPEEDSKKEVILDSKD